MLPVPRPPSCRGLFLSTAPYILIYISPYLFLSIFIYLYIFSPPLARSLAIYLSIYPSIHTYIYIYMCIIYKVPVPRPPRCQAPFLSTAPYTLVGMSIYLTISI